MDKTRCSYVYPFSALVGQELLKKALIINAVNPRTGGVLISGAKGTAKSTAVRALARVLPVMKIVELPLNTTADKLVGSIDMEVALSEGRVRFAPGLLAEADGNILYVDEVNLLDDYLVEILLDSAASGINLVEREGLSHQHSARFILIGTMNPEEGILRPQFLDRFGLFVEVEGIKESGQRMEIMSRRKKFEDDSETFCISWQREDELIRAGINKAKELLPQTSVPADVLLFIADLCIQAGVKGHRADLVMAQAARALAALDGRKEATVEDVKGAAPLVLPQRMTDFPSEAKEEQNLNKQENESSQIHRREEDGISDRADNNNLQDEARELVFTIGETFRAKTIIPPKDKILRKGSGRRSLTRTREKRGRYIGNAYPQGKDIYRDIALDATLRAAAPYQRERRKEGSGLYIEKSDIRTKIRKKSIGASILFVVDASGSMGAKERMVAVKGAVLSLLLDAYQQRDKVGMVAFRRECAELLLPLTKSVELAHKKLAELPTGGKTPLAEGLALGYEILLGELVKDPDLIPLMVIVTDGRANMCVEGGDPFQAAMDIALRIKASPVSTIVLDTEKNFISLGQSRKLCEVLEGQYYKIDDLKAELLAERIGRFVEGRKDNEACDYIGGVLSP